jgi:hypothetical protein
MEGARDVMVAGARLWLCFVARILLTLEVSLLRLDHVDLLPPSLNGDTTPAMTWRIVTNATTGLRSLKGQCS